MNIGDRVFCRAKVNANGKYSLAEYADAAQKGYTHMVAGTIRINDPHSSYCNFLPDDQKDWNYQGSSGWFTDRLNITPIGDAIPPTLRAPAQAQERVLSCRECQTFAPMATANCRDGLFVCFSCRDTKGWKFKGILI